MKPRRLMDEINVTTAIVGRFPVCLTALILIQ
jgi:hypothetical protein